MRRARGSCCSFGLLLRLERLFDLLLDAAVVLRQHLLLFFSEDPERDADQALLELDVEPVLAVLDAARDVEIEAAEACTRVAQLDLVPRHGPLIEIREEADAAGMRGHRREVIDR